MARVDDVAAAVLDRTGQIDTWKLQKLVYYCQAWHLVWETEPLFDAPIEAWANGPVVRELYIKHRGRFEVSDWEWGNASDLTPDESSTVEEVFNSYGHLSGAQLRHLTHSEAPWRAARAGLAPADRSSRVIDPELMYDYYSGVLDDPEARPVDEFADYDSGDLF